MLVYRDFAEQRPDRRYGPGRLMRPGRRRRRRSPGCARSPCRTCARLVDELEETVNLMVLAGADVRFVATVECGHVLRVGDRTGRTLPAHLASGGKAMLAALPPERAGHRGRCARRGCGGAPPARTRAVRRHGFAVNDQATENGLTAVGVAVPERAGLPRAAISLAMPTVRYSRARLPGWGAALSAAAEAIARDATVR